MYKKIFKHKTGPVFPRSKLIEVDNDFAIGTYRNIQISGEGRIRIMKNVQFREFCNILVYNNGYLKISDNVFFNNYCSINCLKEIEIGENTLFGEGVKIYDHNHKHAYEDSRLVVSRDSFTTASVKIGKNCWIGSNVTILKGVEIGDNSIIGAGNVIYKSVAPNAIVKLQTNTIIESREK